MTPQESYIYGLLLADGNLYFSHDKKRKVDNRGRVTLELNERDKDIVLKLCNVVPCSHMSTRTRNTNFKEGYTTWSFVNSQKSFRDWLVECGFPKENKTFLAKPPSCDYSEFDFWRGFIDGDGSLGFIKRDGHPFVSLVTDSSEMKESYLDFLLRRYGIKKISNRNKRDNAYNIGVGNEDAVQLAKDLYLSSDLYLDRKYKKAVELQSWVRTKQRRPYLSSHINKNE